MVQRYVPQSKYLQTPSPRSRNEYISFLRMLRQHDPHLSHTNKLHVHLPLPYCTVLTMNAEAQGLLTFSLRQHRTKTIFCILYASCLHIFRNLAQFVLTRRQPCFVLIVQSDEKSDCTIRAQSLCGIALIYMYGLTPVMTVT